MQPPGTKYNTEQSLQMHNILSNAKQHTCPFPAFLMCRSCSGHGFGPAHTQRDPNQDFMITMQLKRGGRCAVPRIQIGRTNIEIAIHGSCWASLQAHVEAPTEEEPSRTCHQPCNYNAFLAKESFICRAGSALRIETSASPPNVVGEW